MTIVFGQAIALPENVKLSPGDGRKLVLTCHRTVMLPGNGINTRVWCSY
jgi:hypothetical protein